MLYAESINGLIMGQKGPVIYGLGAPGPQGLEPKC